MFVVSFQLCIDAMRLILVKPTNATRRLDSTGEVFHDRDREHYTSVGPSPRTKTPEGKRDRYPVTSTEASSSPEELSLGCVSSSPHKRSNGVSPPRASAPVSPLKTQNLTLSQLNDQDWLLLCGHVNSVDDSPSTERAGTSVGHTNRNDRCGCSCPDEHQHSEASTFQPQSKHGTVQDCISRVTNKRTLSSSPDTQSSSQITQGSTSRQALAQQIHQKDVLKLATSNPQDNFTSHCSDQEVGKELLQQHPCNHFKLKDSSQATFPNLFNIPLSSVECVETYQKLQQWPQPAVSAAVSWRELFGKEPLLVQQRQKQDSHGSITGNQACKPSVDPSIVLKCHHLPDNPPTSTPRVKRSSTLPIDKSVQSLSISQYSSLENQDLVEERAGLEQSQVQDFSLSAVAS